MYLLLFVPADHWSHYDGQVTPRGASVSPHLSVQPQLGASGAVSRPLSPGSRQEATTEPDYVNTTAGSRQSFVAARPGRQHLLL